MHRRDSIKYILLGTSLPFFSLADMGLSRVRRGGTYESDWGEWPDMKWAGPQFWGNRLQDWQVEAGKLRCICTGENRSLHNLVVQNLDGQASFSMSIRVDWLRPEYSTLQEGCIGFRLGAKGPFSDYRSAAVFGKGLDIGLQPDGSIKVGATSISTSFEGSPTSCLIQIVSEPGIEGMINLKIGVKSLDDRVTYVQQTVSVPCNDLAGNIALLGSAGKARHELEGPLVDFSQWIIKSEDLLYTEDQLFGPICFAQYTVHAETLKLTTQLAPVEQIKGHQVVLEIQENGKWKRVGVSRISNPGRAVHFRVDGWHYKQNIPYRVVLSLPLKSEIHQYEYPGTIATEPQSGILKTAVFSCNAHYGFPDQDICDSIDRLKPDMAVFLGDQFYESTGGFGIDFRNGFDHACLDYLRKWMMFGWSYREIFRHIPCAIIPDDHDVWHGNVWGEGGKAADVSQGYSALAQDSGGYKMPPVWVNMVQFTQTSHLPDAYDPTPAKQGIGVYYTEWVYGGVSFAILEDRKFKSAPKHVLPADAQVWNGWIQNPDFDIQAYKHLEAELLGERQEDFLGQWAGEWQAGVKMKAVLSQTNFAAVATIPADAMSGAVIPRLPLPEKGEYIEGDKPTVDMDSNGWPVTKREKALGLIRKAYAFHIAGDQHLATFVKYGIDEFGDCGYAFAGPALNNLWPRRFWPSRDAANHTYDSPAYTGPHRDGFGYR
ncbi:MAG: alkaline phosphatase D family protein, partial [Saprospiraceae bacterium]|nr:alkaline phosphatase D family protein [Saprospiraceae bacterium]